MCVEEKYEKNVCNISGNFASNNYIGVLSVNSSNCDFYKNILTENMDQWNYDNMPSGGIILAGSFNKINKNIIKDSNIGIGIFDKDEVNGDHIGSINNILINNM